MQILQDPARPATVPLRVRFAQPGGWHRAGFRLFWRWKSRSRRPPIPPELRALIREMARDNPGWGEERIANELLLKLGIQVSPRTVRKYMPKGTTTWRSALVHLRG